MSSRYSWDELIPADEEKIAVRFLIEIWDRLVDMQSNRMRYSQHEPKLTERLCSSLNDFKAESGLTGFWVNELQSTLYSAKGRLKARIKKDITYLSNSSGKQLSLIFEFKKLSLPTIAAYRGEHGMRRFVDGNYAIGEPLAVMIGITKGSSKELVKTLCESLSKPAMQSKLKMVHDAAGCCVRIPSVVFEAVADFDTEHRRPLKQASPNGFILLAHIFVECQE